MRVLPWHQSGVVLAVTLFMLALLTLIGISAVTMSTTHFRLTGNLQTETEMEAGMNMAVENYLSSATPFNRSGGTCNPAPQVMTINGRAVTVDIDEPVCTGIIDNGAIFLPYTWDIRASVTDSLTGSTMAAHWGVSIPLPLPPAGSPSYCKPVPSGNAC